MLSILREKLIFHALKLDAVNQVYRNESQRFVAAYFAWLDDAEKDLSALRTPISIAIQAEKSAILALADGYLPAHVQAGKSMRKTSNAAAALSLEKLAKEMANNIERLDHQLEQLQEKLCHAVAVLGSKDVALYASLSADQPSVALLWQKLAGTAETMPMYHYFCAKLGMADLSYLLLDILAKIVSNRVAP